MSPLLAVIGPQSRRVYSTFQWDPPTEGYWPSVQACLFNVSMGPTHRRLLPLSPDVFIQRFNGIHPQTVIGPKSRCVYSTFQWDPPTDGYCPSVQACLFNVSLGSTHRLLLALSPGVFIQRFNGIHPQKVIGPPSRRVYSTFQWDPPTDGYCPSVQTCLFNVSMGPTHRRLLALSPGVFIQRFNGILPQTVIGPQFRRVYSTFQWDPPTDGYCPSVQTCLFNVSMGSTHRRLLALSPGVFTQRFSGTHPQTVIAPQSRRVYSTFQWDPPTDGYWP